MVRPLLLFGLASFFGMMVIDGTLRTLRPPSQLELSQVLEASENACLDYYEQHGSLPASGSDLPVLDLWGRKTVFTGESCCSAGIDGHFGGKDDICIPCGGAEVDRTLRERTKRILQEAQTAYTQCPIGPQDVKECMRECREKYQGREQAECMRRCRQQGGSNICISSGFECAKELVRVGCLEGRHAVDAWGTVLWFSFSQQKFTSCGPDGICGNQDDVS